MANVVTGKGRVTIPKPVRDGRGIVGGSIVDFELASDGRVVRVTAGGKSGRFGPDGVCARLRHLKLPALAT